MKIAAVCVFSLSLFLFDFANGDLNLFTPSENTVSVSDNKLVANDIAEINNNKSENMININVNIDGKIYAAQLYNNPTTQALIKKFPLTIAMDELNGNEKYFFFDDSLPTDTQKMDSVKTGDIMLYGDDCLVLFYEDCKTSYSYTKLGYISEISSLAEDLKETSVSITFSLE